MGWMNCGQDSQGRYIGYGHSAICDHPGCTEKIHRGLSYVCGDMHGEDEISCEKYFCSKHKSNYVVFGDLETTVCDECARTILEDNKEDWEYDEDEGILRYKEKTK